MIEIRSGPAPGSRNMALDTLLLEMADRGEIGFALRTYRWSPHCVSIGRLQDPSVLDAEALAGAGVDCVRRPTGGTAVWHGRELTYCVAAARSHPLVAGSVADSLARIGSVLLSALARLGVRAEMGGDPRSGTRPAACFVSHGLMEISAGGRKLVGSAQARRRNAFLEHGSILLSNDQPRLTAFLRDGGGASPAGTSCSLDEFCGAGPEELRRALHDAFAEVLGGAPAQVPEDSLDPVRLSALESGLMEEALSWR
jgi:lipoate-protein ligase A